MSVPVLTFFNNKGGVGKTSLVYHLAWMFSQIGWRVLACDLDPQANLTSAFLPESRLVDIWDDGSAEASTIFRSIQPLTKVGDIRPPSLEEINSNLYLLPGDLALSGFEDRLSSEWPDAMGSGELYRPFRILSSFWQVIQLGAAEKHADIVLVDIGPNLGAINRSALIATDYVVMPLGADIFSIQGLRNLGPTLKRWRMDWEKRLSNWENPDFDLPAGKMQPLGYVVQQHSVRLSRPVKAYDRWVARIPLEYRKNVLGGSDGVGIIQPDEDIYCLARLKHYRSLMPLGQEALKPIFNLTVADGAIGSHAAAVREAWKDFHDLAQKLKGMIEERNIIKDIFS